MQNQPQKKLGNFKIVFIENVLKIIFSPISNTICFSIWIINQRNRSKYQKRCSLFFSDLNYCKENTFIFTFKQYFGHISIQEKFKSCFLCENMLCVSMGHYMQVLLNTSTGVCKLFSRDNDEMKSKAIKRQLGLFHHAISLTKNDDTKMQL